MKNVFRFRFESMLNLRKAVRDERSNELAQALEAEAKLRGWMVELNQQIAASRGRRAAVGEINADLILSAASYEGTLRATLMQYQRDLEQVQQETERRRQALVAADQQVRVLEKLRDKQQQQHEAELLQHEIKFLDEIATVQTYRRQSSSEAERD